MNKQKKKEKRNIFIYLLFFIALLFLYGYYIEPKNLSIKEYKIENKDIPDSFDGLKIIHFSDVHYKSTVDTTYLKKIVNLINKQNPDLVIFTGDFLDKRFDYSNKEIEEIKNELNKIESTLGNFAVSGNHDMVNNPEDFKNIFSENFTILENEEKLIYYKETTPISLVGFSDALETKVNYEILEKENNYFRFIMLHEPDEYEKIKEYDFDIMFAGHSHNGQVRLPLIGTIYTPVGSKKYYQEYYKLDNREIFISNGIGTSGLDVRFLSSPSINLYRIYAY